jgi:hypothetical protein
MKLLVGESSGAAGEDVDCGALCKTDFSDLRFTKADGITLLDYWIESVSGITPNQLVTVWIEFDSIGTGATTFYMYYGNAGAAAASNGLTTFPLFDHFDAASLDAAKWQTYGTVTATTAQDGGSSVSVAVNDAVDNAGIRSLVNLSSCVIRGRVKFGTTAQGLFWLRRIAATLSFACFTSEAASKAQSYNSSGDHQETNYSPDKTAYHVYELKHLNNVSQAYHIDDAAAFATHTTTKLTATDLRLNLGGYKSGGTGPTVYADWMLIRQYVATEPAWGAWGAEESALQHYTFALESGSFSMIGTAARLLNNKSLVASPGSFAMVGKDMGMPKALVPFSLEPGAFAMTGAALSIGRPVSYMRMDPGAFSMIGKPVDVKYHWYSGEAGSNYEFQKQRRKF